MGTKHTPGPWEISKIIEYKIIASKTAITVADCCMTNLTSKKERDANVQLIAAAPDLLDTLQGVLACYEAMIKEVEPKLNSLDFYSIGRARAVIKQATAKAEGGP